VIKANVNTLGLQKRLAGLNATAPEAGEVAVKLMAEEFVSHALSISPRDTNRYVRGWVEAGNKSGVGSWPLPPLIDSKFADKLAVRLELQLAKNEGRQRQEQAAVKYWADLHEKRYLSQGRTDKWERSLLKKKRESEARLEKVTALVERAREQLKKYHAGAIVIWGKKTKREFSLGQLATVRESTYGGDGQVIKNGFQTLVLLHNLEAHASIVEKRWRVVARSGARMRAVGFKKASKAMVQAIQTGWKRAG
jgi:hypothetical protein